MLVLALFTFTCIGPLIEACCQRRDKRLLNLERFLAEHPDFHILNVPEGVNAASGAAAYRLVYRWVVPEGCDETTPPVILPNGLAATQLALARVQDELARLGLRSLSFDRLGTGFTDDNPSGQPASAWDMVHEMDFLMRSVLRIHQLPADTKWIGIGASMGQACLEAFMVVFPDRFVGLHNLDGLPYGFVRTSKQYLKTYAPMYAVEGSLCWTGAMRLLMNLAGKSLVAKLKSELIPDGVVLAQMKQPRFWRNTKLEFFTMLSCAELSNAGWAHCSVLRMKPHELAILASARPRESVIVDEPRGLPRSVTEERSRSELGRDWQSDECVAQTLEGLVARAKAEGTCDVVDPLTSFSDLPRPAVGSLQGGVPQGAVLHSLPAQWSSLVVRVMGMRAYDMGDGAIGKMAYSQDQRNWSGASQNMHVLLAADGARLVYPRLTHTNGFAQSREIASQVVEIVEILQRRPDGGQCAS